jgi:hypothetical protein
MKCLREAWEGCYASIDFDTKGLNRVGALTIVNSGILEI